MDNDQTNCVVHVSCMLGKCNEESPVMYGHFLWEIEITLADRSYCTIDKGVFILHNILKDHTEKIYWQIVHS